MKRLSDLTMSQYIDTVCGDLAHMSGKDKNARERNRRDVMLEFQEICDPSGLKRYIRLGSSLTKAKARLSVFSICQELLSLDREESARDILSTMGVNTKGMDAQRLQAEIQSRIARAKKDIADNTADEDSGADERKIRASYDSQTAFLMSYFKFHVDPDVMKATHYANLLAQCDRELKAQKAQYERIRNKR